MKVEILNKKIENYHICIETKANPAVNYAGLLLQRYLKKITGYSLSIVDDKDSAFYFQLIEPHTEFDDGFEIKAVDNGICFSAKNYRGIIYSVYSFLEYLGYRFFSVDFAGKGVIRGDVGDAEEMLFDTSDKLIDKDFCIKESPSFYYRDNYTHAVTANEDFLKFRLNAGTWDFHNYSEELGGGLFFTGVWGHSFKYYVSQSEFYHTHPEFFAEKDGERVFSIADGFSDEPQLCMTNDELVDVFVDKLKLQLEKRYENFISVSQNDSDHWCTCSKCLKSYEKYGYSGTLLNFVNKIARKLKVDYPEVKIHTYTYMQTADINGTVKADDNVIIQFCPRPCHSHALTDENCLPNKLIYANLKKLKGISNNILIYDYRSCIGHALFLLPDIFLLRENMRTYAENGVRGIYTEGCEHSIMQPTLEELRLYLFAKLAWNPYMSEEEYDKHIDEFLCGFYGKNWQYVKEFLRYWCDNAKKYHVDSFSGTMLLENYELMKKPDQTLLRATLFDKEAQPTILAHCHKLLDKAKEGVEEKYEKRIEIIRTSLIWYRLFHDYDEIMENGSAEEKKAIMEENSDLCTRMKTYLMKFTLEISLDKAKNIYGNYMVSPAFWHGDTRKYDLTDNYCFNRDSTHFDKVAKEMGIK